MKNFFLALAISLFVLSGQSGVYAQTGSSEYADSFCSYYEYSVECYVHRQGVSTKVAAFAEKFTGAYADKPASFALVKARDFDDKLSEYVNYYADTQREYLILLLRDSLRPHMYTLEEEVLTLSLTQEYLESQISTHTDKAGYIDQIRRLLISQLIENGFDGFNQNPYGSSDTSGLLITEPETAKVFVTSPLSDAQDLLDMYLQEHFGDLSDTLDGSISELTISPSVYRSRAGNVQLFKTTEDLQGLGYQLVSHRVRTNNDAAYRRKNITTAFEQIGHVRVLNPGDEISYMEDSNFDPQAQQLYEDGFVIFLDEEVEDYGGGLCGGSTAIYQGIVTNKALSKPALRNHSKRYHHLYDATIDGQRIDTPGIDSTIYSNSLDLRMRNISDHPVILVLNYGGGLGEAEEIFTVGYPSDKGSITYVSSRPYYASLNVKGGGSRKVTGQCHTRNINGTERESCYKEIKS